MSLLSSQTVKALPRHVRESAIRGMSAGCTLTEWSSRALSPVYSRPTSGATASLVCSCSRDFYFYFIYLVFITTHKWKLLLWGSKLFMSGYSGAPDSETRQWSWAKRKAFKPEVTFDQANYCRSWSPFGFTCALHTDFIEIRAHASWFQSQV